MEVHVIYLLIVVVPKEWTFSKEEEEFLQQLQIDNCESLSIEKRTISQSECQEWFEQKNTELRQVMLTKFYFVRKILKLLLRIYFSKTRNVQT